MLALKDATAVVSIVLTAFLFSPEGRAAGRRRAVRVPPQKVPVERVSIASDGSEWRLSCETSAINGDGRYVVFGCLDPSRIVGSPPLNPGDVYLRDRLKRETTIVSTGARGPLSGWPSVSDDGGIIVFMSGDRPVRDVFVLDRTTGSLTTIPAERAQPVPRVSGDGGTVAFALYTGDLYLALYDRRTGTTTWGTPPSSRDPSLDAEGRFVAFQSPASIDSADTNDATDVLLLDRSTGQLTRPTASSAALDFAATIHAAISADGRFVAFEGYPHESGGVIEVVLHDRLTGQNSRASSGIDGAPPNGDSFLPSVSGGGRYVAFASKASNLVPGDTNGKSDVFIRDRITNRTIRVSVAFDGGESDGDSGRNDAVPQGKGPSLSADGRWVVFSSDATNLVPDDHNVRTDIFVAATGLEPDL